MKDILASLSPDVVEAALAKRLGRLFKFSSLSLYFPPGRLKEPHYIASESLLLAPAERYAGAVVRLDGFEPAGEVDCRLLAGIVDLALDALALERQKEADPETGLMDERALLKKLAEDVSGLAPGHSAKCIGALVIAFGNGHAIRRELGERVFAEIWRNMADAVSAKLPEAAIGARFGLLEGRYEFGVMLPATGRGQCQRLALDIMAALDRVKLPRSLSGAAQQADFRAGHAFYPLDLDGEDWRLPPFERALLLRDRARLAAEMVSDGGNALAWAWLPARAGMIIERISPNLARINLGATARIRPGQRFGVADPQAGLSRGKAQIIARHIGKTESIAEIFHVESPDAAPGPGDRLFFFDSGPSKTSLPGQAEFLGTFQRLSKSVSTFTLSIASYWPVTPEALPELAKNINLGDNTRMGRYGRDSLIFFRPGDTPGQAREFFAKVHAMALELGLQSATGIFGWPLLNFPKAESELCALKALAYAQLLPEPHIGALDSVALTISADKRFSMGDELGAMKEYELALLLKPDEPMALNSLGVCMASLNRPERALMLFEKALACDPESALKAKIYYNIGNLRQKENDPGAAMAALRQCIRADHEHVFAWIKIGDISARAGRPHAARALYRHAATLATSMPDILNIIQRHMARLECSRSQMDAARELLHDSLLRNPADHASILLLAETYLEEDPGMAEMLARKCIRLGGNAWRILARALRALGRENEAAQAEARAS